MANELRIRANVLPVLELDAEFDPGTDTTISAPELADWPVVGATNHLAVTINYDRVISGVEPYILYITAHTSTATTATVVATGQEGTTSVTAPPGTKCIHGPTLRDFRRIGVASFTQSGNLNLNSTAWGDIDATFEASVAAWPGDLVIAHLHALCGNESVDVRFDVKVTTAGSTTYMSTASEGTPGTNGAVGWFAGGATIWRMLSGPIYRQVVANDISSNVFTGRVRYRTSAASNKTLFVDTASGYTAEFVLEAMPQYVAATF